MDYQPMEQTTQQMTGETMEQDSSAKVWYIIIGALVVIALGLWYFYWTGALTATAPTSAVEQAEIPALTGGDTTADISADLNQIPDTSAVLDADAAASADAIQGL